MISDVVACELQISRGWPREFVDKLAPYYIATLTHMHRGHATPVYQVIDEIWHAHILCTRDYADFCARQFGRFMHHERSDGVTNNGEKIDFFREYGLSLASLNVICGEYSAARNSDWASCTSPANCSDGAKAHAEAAALDSWSVASCGLPSPNPTPPGSPAIAARYLNVATCGPADPPRPPSRQN